MTATTPVSLRPKKKRKRLSPGWVSDQHGAWAMVFVPLILGIVLGGPAWIHVPLSFLWVVGYFAFFATGLWLKSRRKARYFPPVRAYCLVVGALGIWVLAARPDMVVWLPLFLPLLVTSMVCSHKRKDRSLLNDTVLVLAASLMVPVAYYAAQGWDGTNWTGVWLACALAGAYFFGTVLYVKTVIRERGSRPYLRWSVSFHWGLALVPLFLALPQVTLLTWGQGLMLSALFVVLAVRAMIVPTKKVTPKQLGIGEIYASTALTLLLILICG